MKSKIVLKSASECTGCGACLAACPRGAITKKKTGFGAWIPKINASLCVRCGLCESVCHKSAAKEISEKKAYIAYNKNLSMRIQSASGGVFSALATYVLEHDGCVFGAEMRFEQGNAVVEHIMVTQTEDLYRILGSKYVQSDCSSAYVRVKKQLKDGKTVLFSGCSCQITGLKNYLGDVNQSNLYTVDLICHGVPGIDLFNDYINFLEKKYDGSVSSFSFRSKEQDKITYEASVNIDTPKNSGGGTNCCTSNQSMRGEGRSNERN